MKTLKTFKRELLADKQTRVAYQALGDEFSLVHELISARTRAGLTQAEVADRMGTTQSVIARLEGGHRQPLMRTVQRYAEALGCRAVVRLEPV
jgi:predicted transcriptional regulator